MAHCLAVLGVTPHDTRDFDTPALSAVQQAAMMPEGKPAPLNLGGQPVSSSGPAARLWAVQTLGRVVLCSRPLEQPRASQCMWLFCLQVLRERFHPFTPGQHFTWQPPKKRKKDGSSQDW